MQSHYRRSIFIYLFFEKDVTMLETIYTNGDYLAKNPGWHIEESPWKARNILRMLQRNSLSPNTICEVGCGAGEILRQLQTQMEPHCTFWGYEISPQAFEFCQSRANERLHFKLANLQQEQDVHFDLMLVIDLFEHVEDHFSFLRDIHPQSDYKIFHIPLDLSVQTVLRRDGLLHTRNAYGHLHYFTKDLALRTLQDTGYEVLDYFYTSGSLELPTHVMTTKLMRLPRRIAFRLHPDLTVRILGGFRLLALAK
jgi:cyclopropane fatty-acyl-phospholipid synthase-like methyltransferase